MIEDENYSQIRKNFQEKFYKEIVPVLKKYENERKKKLIIAIISVLVCCLIGLYFLYLAYISEFSTYVFISSLLEISLVCILGWYIIKKGYKNKIRAVVCLIILLFILVTSNNVANKAFEPACLFFCLAGFLWDMIKKGFEKKIKTKIMPMVSSCLGKLRWTEGFYGYDDLFQESCVVPKFTRSNYDDTFDGVHNGVSFELIEAEYYSAFFKESQTVFDGMIIKLKMNKNFLSHTVITSNSMFHLSPLKELKHTTLEDMEFEKKFDVYTNDEVDARYLITPTFMERLKTLKTAFQADRIQCAFFKDLLLVSLSTQKDLFSLCSLVKPLDDNRQYFQMFEEILSIIKLIDHFKLNEKTGV